MAKDSMILFCWDHVKDSRRVVAESDGVEIHGELSPRPSLVVMCASRNCSFTGSFCSNKVGHELILLGSSTL